LKQLKPIKIIEILI